MSASMNAIISHSASLYPVNNASPLPLLTSWVITRAPALVASASVLSDDPSLTTIISSTNDTFLTTSTTLATVSSSLKAGIITETCWYF